MSKGQDLKPRTVTFAILDNDEDWWVQQQDGTWKCVTERGHMATLEEIQEEFGPIKEIP